MDNGIITTRERFVAQAQLTNSPLPVGRELAQSLFCTTRYKCVVNEKNEDWIWVENEDAKEMAEKVRRVDEKIKKMNSVRMEKGNVGGRPMMDDKDGSPLQVKNRIAKRRSREKIYENNA